MINTLCVAYDSVGDRCVLSILLSVKQKTDSADLVHSEMFDDVSEQK